MTVPDLADAEASYGMPAGGFANYTVDVTDPTTDWSSGNPPGTSATGGNGANQMIVDCAAMTRTACRAWFRFTGDATTPVLVLYEAMWGIDSAYKPVVTHVGTGHYRATYPTTVVDALSVSKTLNFRKAVGFVEGATPYWPPQCSIGASPNVVEIYTFDASHVAADLVGTSFVIEVT